MNVLHKLKEEHNQVAALLEKAKNKNNSSSEKQSLLQEINKHLTLHMNYEEELFYPTFKEKSETKDIVLESYEEHSVVKNLLQELAELPVEDELWLAKLTVLKENIEHHVKEEEEDMFPEVKKLIDAEELEAMADEMQNFKEEQISALSKNKL